MKFQKLEPSKAEIPLAPMIDVVFLLLIFFLVRWNYQQDEQDLSVSVPTSEQGETHQRQLGEIIINVRAEGLITIDGQTLTDQQLSIRLSSIARSFRDEKTGKSRQPVRIRGSAEVEYQRIVEVISLCQEAGIWNISFSTKKITK